MRKRPSVLLRWLGAGAGILLFYLLAGCVRVAWSVGCDYPNHAIHSLANVLLWGSLCEPPLTH